MLLQSHRASRDQGARSDLDNVAPAFTSSVMNDIFDVFLD